jgi:hypothetical protein
MAARSTQEICFLSLSSARSGRGVHPFNAKASERRAGDQFLEICVDAGAATLTDLSDNRRFLGASAPARGAGEALWWAQRYALRDVICVIDADLAVPDEASLRALIAEDLSWPRSIAVAGPPRSDGAGWNEDNWLAALTEVTVRPTVRLYAPALAAIGPLLTGCVLIRRQALAVLPMATDVTWSLSILLSAARILGTGVCTEIEREGIRVPAAPAGLDRLAQQALAVVAQASGGEPFAAHLMADDPYEPGGLLPPLAQLGV